MEVKTNPNYSSSWLSLKKFALPILLLLSCSTNKKLLDTTSTYTHNTKIIKVKNCCQNIDPQKQKEINKTLFNISYECGPEIESLFLYEENLVKNAWNAWYADDCGIQLNLSLPSEMISHVIYHEQAHRIWLSLDESEQELFYPIFERIQKWYTSNPIIYSEIIEINSYADIYKDSGWVWKYSIETLMSYHEEFFAHMYMLNSLFKKEMYEKLDLDNPIWVYVDTIDKICKTDLIACN